MSEYASAVDRVRRAFASVAKLESELLRDSTNVALRINLAASQKIARKSEAQLRSFSELQRVDICNYRLLSEKERGWTLAAISRSLSDYQSLFSQIHDAIKNGPKNVARFGQEVMQESAMELAYTYSGSLGFVLLAYSDRDFFEGRLDKAIDTLLEITSIKSAKDVRQIADTFGNAVVKRLYDWSKSNVEGRFSADLVWQRS